MTGETALHALFEFATEGILITNAFGEISMINPSACKLFGYEEKELIGQKIEKLVPEQFRSRHQKQREEYTETPHPRSMGKGIELYALRKDGSFFPVEISLSPYISSKERFIIAFIVDITERQEAQKKLKNYSKELEKEVEQRTMVLREAIDELEKTKEELNVIIAKEKELNDLKTRFVSMVSHEFRTPLATILSSLSLVSKYTEIQDKEKQEKHIQRIKNSVNNLTEILNDVLSLSKLEEGKIIVSKELISIESEIKEIITEMQLICKPGQKIHYQHKGNNEMAYLDPKILRHVMMNLISNAIKFSHENQPIKVDSMNDENEIFLSVKDEGIGISEEDQKNLFESFYRAQNAVNIQGTGLGLNIVARYVDLCGGKIKLESKLNNGTKFIIKIPNQ